MLKYAKVINNETGLCEVGTGTNWEFYQSVGMTELDVQQSDVNGMWYLSDKCPMKTETEKEQEKREHISMLTLTAADVERAIYKDKGIDFDDIINIVKNNPLIDIKALKIELKANNFYRGNPYVSQIGTLLGYTESELDYLFINKELPIKIDTSETVENDMKDIGHLEDEEIEDV